MSQKLKLTQLMLAEAKSTKEVLELPAVQQNWVQTYNNVSGKKDGEMRFEAEKILFLQTVGQSDALQKCDKFSIYSAFIELAISGLTLRDGLTYVIPYKNIATFQVGWMGRLEQIEEIPTVVHCHEPQVVYDCDIFEYEKGMRTVIKKHVPEGLEKRTKKSIITHVYFVIEMKSGPVVYIMDRMEVLDIRDNYSIPYQSYVKALGQPINKGKKWGDKLIISYRAKDGSQKTFESNDLPMWVSSEAEAFKKTIVKRAWKKLPKLPKHKWLDTRMEEQAAQIGSNIEDIEELSTPHFDAEQMDSLVNLDSDETVDTETGEVTQSEPVDLTDEQEESDTF